MIDLNLAGTTEHQWRDWTELPPRELDIVPRKVVVLAPHPDDEVLGAGGTLARWTATGTAITIVAVTDGERSHPDSPTWSARGLAGQRRAESVAAWSRLGIADCRVVRLGFADGAVAARESDLAAGVRELCTPDSLCLATWSGDGHPDHDAVGRAALRGATAAGATLLSYPVWMWHWATPADPRVPWRDARAVHLGQEVTAAKRCAAREFVTQVEPLSADPADQPVLPSHVLDRLLREFEVFFV